jgi:predicted methyltransferase
MEGSPVMKSIVSRADPGGVPCAAAVMLTVLMLSGCVSMNTSSNSVAVLSQERIAEIIASPDRSAADLGIDQQRKSDQMLAFIGIRSAGMMVLDLSAGGGYTTELLARAVGPAGRVYGQSAPQSAPPPGRPSSPQALALRVKNSALANIIPVVRPFEDPAPAEMAAAGLDLVTCMFSYHDLGHMGVDRARMNRAVFTALKSGGLYVIADHSGRLGTGISESKTLHRIEEAFLRQEVESAGFQLLAQGNFLRNPSDPRDKNIPEPPTDKDEFVLKFVKP